MKLGGLVGNSKEELEIAYNDRTIRDCEYKSNCVNYWGNLFKLCLRDPSLYPDCLLTKEQDEERRQQKTEHCGFEPNCWNYSPNMNGVCTIEMDDVLECWADVDETPFERQEFIQKVNNILAKYDLDYDTVFPKK